VDTPADHGHTAVLDANVGALPRNAGAVNHGAATDYEVKLWHAGTSISFRCEALILWRSLPQPATATSALNAKGSLPLQVVEYGHVPLIE
jgi:hypothetical protein